MSFFNKKIIALVLGLASVLGGMNVYAASKPQPQSQPQATAQKVSTLGGKFSFELPKGYVASAMPAGEEKNGTAGTTGTMYINQAEKRVIIAVERPLPTDMKIGDNDDTFLDGAVAGFVNQQSAALPDFKQHSESRLRIKGLGVREIDSTATMGGGKTLNATFVAGSGTRMSVVQVVSRADDQAGHAALIKRIVGTP